MENSNLPKAYKIFFAEASEENINEKSYKVKCILTPCKDNEEQKSFHVSKSSTCNLRRHLTNFHPEKLNQESSNSASSPGPSSRRKRGSDFDEALIDFIVEDLETFSKVERPSFKKLILEASKSPVPINISSRPTIMAKLQKRHQHMTETLKDILAKQTSLCLTADCWSSRRRSYLGCTLHWIDNISLLRKSCTLSCTRIEGRHTYDILAKEIHNTIVKYNITQNATHTVTDNASNFGKAFRICTEENFIAYNNMIHNEDSEVNLTGVEINDILKMMDSNDDNFIILPKHIRCMAHTFNLCATNDLNKELEKNPQINLIHVGLLKKSQKLWNAQNTSTVKADFLKEKLKKTLKTPSVTRWNSLYDSLKDLLQIIENNKNDIEDAMNYLKLNMFSATEIKYLSDFIQAFEPVAIALDIIQGETDIYFGMTVPLIIKTRNNLIKIQQRNEPYIKFLSSILITSIDNRFQHLLNKKELLVATVLHPKFKFKFIEKHLPEKLEELKMTVKNEYNKVNEISSESPEPTQSSQSFWDSEDENSQNDSIEYEHYFFSSVSCIEVLKEKKYKNIKKLFLLYNTALPSSASVERLFSVAKRVLTPERMRISDENFEMQLLLHQNAEFLK
uniref:CSON005780 protein n=1 Tax=Culicoides sonorensis TaxID=179676 RepID=A0A336MR45_CULSO